MDSSAKANILLVDDRVENLVALESVLEDLGQNLVTASSGREALKRLLEMDFAVILLDVQMPGMDGFETATLIRSRQRSRHTPIVFLTAINKTETHVTRGYSVGAVDYLFKPFDTEVLRAKVAAFVELFRKTNELHEEISQREQAEAKLDATNALLETISRSLVDYVGEVNASATFQCLLDGIVSLTHSEYGFIAEVVEGSPSGPDSPRRLEIRTVSGSHPRQKSGKFYERYGADLFALYDLEPLFAPESGRSTRYVLLGPSSLNRTHRASHPPLRRMIVLPLYKGDSVEGVVGLANRPDGYDDSVVSYLEPFLGACAIILSAWRNEQRRQYAEEEVRALNNDLERRVRDRTAELEAANRDLEREILERKRAEEEKSRVLALERTARAEAEAAQQRLSFLGEASAVLASSRDYHATLERVARLAAPAFADFCIVDLAGPDGLIHRVATAHSDPAKDAWLREMALRSPAVNPELQPANRALRSADIPIDDSVMAQTLDEDHINLLNALGVQSHIAVPLIVRGETVGAMSFGSSESGRKYALDDLALAEDLARRAAAAIDNAMLFLELQDADRRKDEFLAMLAHELRNPLAAMSNADYVLDEIGSQEPRVNRLRGIINRQTHNLSRMVDDLLDISRITRGRISLQMEPVELQSLVRSAIESMSGLISDRSHELILNLPPESVWMEADPTRLEQVFSNLLHNAAKYTEPGGKIWLDAVRESGDLVIRVRDTGIGIPADLLPCVFDLFTQSERSLDRSEGGLGLGLALVWKLVRMHGGMVTACSDGPGLGSEFVVRLPALPAEYIPEAPPEAPPKAVVTSPRRVLIVEDNRDAAETLSEILELWGHEVRVANNGRDALEMARVSPPEVALLDIGLPEMDGYEVARIFRSDKSLSEVLLVALTGYGQGEDRRLSKEAGFDVHLTKPVDPNELRRLLATAPVPLANSRRR
ncbi:MAG TPA: response regulator [Armatimonadota bacterium]|nr:response regulator [Armatimonadota bacterium]